MGFGEVFATLALITVSIWLLLQAYDYIQVKRGIFPKPSETTIDDIKRLRDNGHVGIAVKRYKQLPENKGLYTDKGAQKKVDEL